MCSSNYSFYSVRIDSKLQKLVLSQNNNLKRHEAVSIFAICDHYKEQLLSEVGQHMEPSNHPFCSLQQNHSWRIMGIVFMRGRLITCVTIQKRIQKSRCEFCGWLDPVISNLYKVIVVKDAVACFFLECANIMFLGFCHYQSFSVKNIYTHIFPCIWT